MIFRPFAQPKPQEPAQLKVIAPSLLSDPAFSADPHCNPYFVTSHETAWASSPPVGHPPLKNKNRRAHAIFTADEDTIDHQLIQPPNSPVALTGPSDHHPPSLVPKDILDGDPALIDDVQDPHSLTATYTRALDSAQSTAASGPAPPSPPPSPSPLPSPPAARTERSSLMSLWLSRRKNSSSGANETSGILKSKKQGYPATANVEHDVTGGRPPALRQVTEPIMPHDIGRPALPARPATTGIATPMSMSTSGSTASKRLAEGLSTRLQDLDRIDELDETNPWGIALHHGGPYEAAIQAMRRGDSSRMPLGFVNNGSNEYHRRAMEAHGNVCGHRYLSDYDNI